MDLPTTHRWPNAKRAGDWYVRLDDALPIMMELVREAQAGGLQASSADGEDAVGQGEEVIAAAIDVAMQRGGDAALRANGLVATSRRAMDRLVEALTAAGRTRPEATRDAQPTPAPDSGAEERLRAALAAVDAIERMVAEGQQLRMPEPYLGIIGVQAAKLRLALSAGSVDEPVP
jgi:hypothetical protein